MAAMRLFKLLLQLPLYGFRDGKIYGVPVSRNPIAWIPFFLVLPVVPIAIIVWVVVVYPILIIASIIGSYRERRKVGQFTGTGVILGAAYRQKELAWSEIRRVVRHREPANLYYKLFCNPSQNTEVEILFFTWEFDSFEKALVEHAVPLAFYHWSHGYSDTEHEED